MLNLSPPLSDPQMCSSSADCLHGLKSGHKIYFEDVTMGAPPKSTAGGASSSSGTGTKKGRSGTLQGARPPRCQVECCSVDLSDAKPYYSRHKVCIFHSKSPKVIVAGLEQRFCQQCSRFHQLTEFDQEKRSCRRRLAGHNERRRKPQPSSLLISPYARFSSAVFENRGRVGGFLMEFAAYRKPTLASTSTEQVSGNQSSTTPWQGNLQLPELFLRGSMGSINSFGPSHLGECFAGIADTSCALSLLSNQTWGFRNTLPALGVNNLCFEGTSITQLAASSHGAPMHHLSNASGSFNGIEPDTCLHDDVVVPDLGAAPISLSNNSELPGGLVMPQPDRQYVDRQSEAYESSQLMHWSL
ncbi:squamosa promoter-binding-like protein 17 isoform X2 [Prosopis cineraria]|uniref:squamosa promoter-binding-like protein 17 isoform X2 n=1 Tax=Prosopis cineraria TaxID=364024 RepID=UPI00240F4E77|nr:squamosa promoter-binding-like protein 17 isoform X2 [Prosopis cineraria]